MSNVVSFDKTYYNIVSNQLGNVILVDNIDTANRISKKINQRYKIVTLDGDVVHVGGTMSGGSINTTKSIFSEKQELERLKKEEIQINEVLKTLETNILDINKNLNSFEEKLQTEQINLIKTQEKLNVKNNTKTEFKEIYDSVVNELKSLENIIDSSIDKEEEKIMNAF